MHAVHGRLPLSNWRPSGIAGMVVTLLPRMRAFSPAAQLTLRNDASISGTAPARA
jgi:hypothetical protein